MQGIVRVVSGFYQGAMQLFTAPKGGCYFDLAEKSLANT